MKDPGDLLHMKRFAVHEMIDATPGRFAAREPDDRPRDVIRRRHVQQKIQVGNRPEFGIEPDQPPDQIRFVADSIDAIAGDAAQAIDRDRQAARCAWRASVSPTHLLWLYPPARPCHEVRSVCSDTGPD